MALPSPRAFPHERQERHDHHRLFQAGLRECTATTRALEARGLALDLVDLTEDAAALKAVTAMDYRQAPVVVAGDLHWAGFRPDMIDRLA